MIGAIIGDIIGSAYEFDPVKTKDFPLWTHKTYVTDDSIMTVAVGKALLRNHLQGDDLYNAMVEEMRAFGRRHPDGGYGLSFRRWLYCENPQPYNSFGNGSAMRVSACAYAAKTLEQALALAEISALVSHNHPEGIKGAQAAAAAVFMARTGASKAEIRKYINQHFYPLTQTLDEIRPDYYFNEICQDTVPQAIISFLESENYEDAIRNAVSLGGDADTLAAITGAIAWAYYGRDGKTPDMVKLEEIVRTWYLTEDLLQVVDQFRETFC